MKMSYPAELDINLNALSDNFHFLKSKIKSSTKFMAVVKAFGYGSDESIIAKHLQYLGVDYFAVAFTHEGVALRQKGINIPILVFLPLPSDSSLLIEYNLEPALYNYKMLVAFLSELKDKPYPIHLKFNTGLNRLGFSENDVEAVLKKIDQSKGVFIKSVYSHLAASEDILEKEFTENQIKIFENIVVSLKSKLSKPFLTHILNTSGILNYADKGQFDMVRSGIGLHGYGNNEKFSAQLKPISTLKTTIVQIHTIQEGDTLGYNRQFVSEREMKIAVLPIGHADGIDRIYGNGKGFVFIHDKKCKILGNVCMDMIMIDVTGVDCNEGDAVILFGRNTSAELLSESAGTISYELITGIALRVNRVM